MKSKQRATLQWITRKWSTRQQVMSGSRGLESEVILYSHRRIAGFVVMEKRHFFSSSYDIWITSVIQSISTILHCCVVFRSDLDGIMRCSWVMCCVWMRHQNNNNNNKRKAASCSDSPHRGLCDSRTKSTKTKKGNSLDKQWSTL